MRNYKDDVIQRLVHWAKRQPLVRAAVLTSSRAVPGAPVDVFSDYDVILALGDVRPFYEDRRWLEAFGPVLALYRDPLGPYEDYPEGGYVIQYESGLKIDFTLWPADILRRAAAEPQLPPELDAGYRVLIDKDALTDGLKPPTYTAYIPTRPTESAYQASVETFFLDTTYVAKLLWRGDLMAAKHILDHVIKQEQLLTMLEWHLESDHGWSVKTGPYGRGLKEWLRPDLWADLLGTYTGPEPDANWEALFASIALFRKTAVEVGGRLGYAYPHDLERRAIAYLRKVQNLTPDADSLPW